MRVCAWAGIAYFYLASVFAWKGRLNAVWWVMSKHFLQKVSMLCSRG
jgi:hypothetical protein